MLVVAVQPVHALPHSEMSDADSWTDDVEGGKSPVPVLDKPLGFYQHIVRYVMYGKCALGLQSWKHAVVAWLM